MCQIMLFLLLYLIIVMLWGEQLLYFLFGHHLSCGQHLTF